MTAVDNAASLATYVIAPGAQLPDGGANDVGNKAWNLMRMARARLLVPAGFVLSTAWCKQMRVGEVSAETLRGTLQHGIAQLEAATGLRFGSSRRPLLVSVRSGAAVSMPGMMETVLDVGLNAQSVDGLIRLTGNPRLAWDCYRRLIFGYATVVAAASPDPFDAIVARIVAKEGVRDERELDYRALRTLARAFAEQYRSLVHAAFPSDPFEQLLGAVRAVFQSWDAPKAVAYRNVHAIDGDGGTAVTVQAMVYGNGGGLSGSGVAFTRDPATGEPKLYCDFVFNGQGEDVVAGRRVSRDAERLQAVLPKVWSQLEETGHRLEALFHDVQDFEFTVEAGRLYLLQTRRAQRTPWAALRIAVDLVAQGLITPDAALEQLNGVDLERVARLRFVPPLPQPIGHATAAGVGVVSGAVALDEAAAKRLSESGTHVVLVRPDMVTGDITAIASADAILTASGARTSHAAVVARQLGKLCLVACPTLTIDMQRRTCTIGGREIAEGAELSLDGSDGAIYADAIPVETERPERELSIIAGWKQAHTGERA